MRKPTLKDALVVLIPTVLAFALGPVIWKMQESGVEPEPWQIALLIGLSISEAVSFGLGVWFLLYGLPPRNASGKRDSLASWAHASVTWHLINWWPHDNFHRVNGDNLNRLIAIEYAFHVTLIIATIIIMKYLLREFRRMPR